MTSKWMITFGDLTRTNENSWDVTCGSVSPVRNHSQDCHATSILAGRGICAAWHQNGFTFLEVMISLAVLAACLVVLLKLQSRAVNSFNESRIITETLMLARNKMAETEAAGFPELGKKEGDFGEKYPGYRWIREVSETGVDVLRKVSMVVMPPGRDNGPGTVRLETFLARVERVSPAELAGGGTPGQGSTSSESEGNKTLSSSGEAEHQSSSAPSTKP